MTTENLGRVVGFSILSGAGVPGVGLGDNGDSYLNTTNGDVYLKDGGVWGSPTGNIRGIQGVQGFSVLSGAGAPTTQGVDGDSYLNTTNGDTYLKSSGIWSLNGNIKGIQGDKPTINTNSTTSNTIATGAKTFTLTAPLDLAVGQIAKAYSLSDPNNYMCGFITSLSPFTINVSEIGGSGTKTDWVIALSGFRGMQGITTTNMSSGKVLGRITAGVGTPEELTPVGLTLKDSKLYNSLETERIAIRSNVALLYVDSDSVGSIKISIPSASLVGAVMYLFKGTIGFYDVTSSSNRTCTFTIGCYNYVVGEAITATFYGANAPKFPVKFFQNVITQECYITIGELTQVWSYLGVSIDTAQARYSVLDLQNALTDIELSLITENTLTLRAELSETRPQFNPNQILSEYVAASGVDTPLTNAMSPLQMFQNLQKQNDNRYTKSEADAKITAINIGGRNYQPNSEVKATTGFVPTGNAPTISIENGNELRISGIDAAYLNTPQLSQPIASSEVVTLSFWVKNNSAIPLILSVTANGNNAIAFANVSANQGWTKVTGTALLSTVIVGTQLTGMLFEHYTASTFDISVKLIKVEIGNKATDWTPAIEDVSNDATIKANAAQTAAQNYADAQDSINLQAAKDDATAKVNTALALKANIAASTGTSVALTFTSDSVQGTVASPLTGNITGNITGAKLGVVTLVIHKHTTAPTFDSKYKKLSGSGSYVTGSINYIFCEYINDTEIIYSINQRT